MSLPSERSLRIAARTNICSFKVVILFFTRALSEQKGKRTVENALGDDERRVVKSVPARALLN